MNVMQSTAVLKQAAKRLTPAQWFIGGATLTALWLLNAIRTGR